MECVVCGVAASASSEVYVNESWTGKWQSACNHAACGDCLSRCVDEQLPRCEAASCLRVTCFSPGCGRSVPQKLVLHVSRKAREAAVMIDRYNHGADGMEAKYRELKIEWQRTICPICAENVSYLVCNSNCSHRGCEWCWEQWTDAQLPDCRALRQLQVRCFGEACGAKVEDKVVLHTSNASRALKRQLDRRAKLRGNALYPPELQVDCPNEGCVGLGYLGFDTVMCFLCEHQWIAESGEAPGTEMPGEVKECPRCRMPIEKNGGCNHMTCRCGHEFYWSTMLPYR
eukprot:TRINITY_DN12127_c0_g1_i1.p1 TRINITY_DN12127_c0_g1~~TRINITY_DN12127_c0_g1_i1.p1  ORF type:complete len:286 (+),score=29.46 TRINITY_DN12127_c0_g1_i1:211-1068(+)